MPSIKKRLVIALEQLSVPGSLPARQIPVYVIYENRPGAPLPIGAFPAADLPVGTRALAGSAAALELAAA